MTPKREAYLAKCGYKEKWLRSIIRTHKEAIKKSKEKLTNIVFDSMGQVAVCKSSMRTNRWLIASLRHELARLKGMDRVVVPRGMGYYRQKGWCVCDIDLERSKHTYCPNCGRKILWR